MPYRSRASRYFTGRVLNIDDDFWIDSNLKWRASAVNLLDYSLAVREV